MSPAGPSKATKSPAAIVYTARGLIPQPAGRLGPSPRVWSPFVGRTRELALLHDRLAMARAVRQSAPLSEALIERLADHALRGKAVDYCRQAGEKAMARSAPREAVGSFEQALRALPHLPERRHTREQSIDLRLALRNALFPSADLGRILTHLREAEALVASLDDTRRLAQVSVLLSNHLFMMGAYDQAIAAGQRALALAKAGEDVLQHALTNRYLGVVYKAEGDYRRAIDCFGQAVAFFEGARRYERFGQILMPAVFSRASLACCQAELGAFAEGRALGDEGLRIAEAVAHPASLMFALWGIDMLDLCQGDLPRALPALERAVTLCQGTDLSGYFPRMAAVLGVAYARIERVADAVPLLTQALAQSRVMARAPFEILCAREPKPTTGKPSLWPRSWGCGGSRPTATSASGRCMPRVDSPP